MTIFAEMGAPARTKPLSCEDVNRFIVGFLDETMDHDTRVQFEAHPGHGPNCDAFLEQYRETVHLVRDAETLELPDELVHRTIEILKHHYRD